MPIIYHYSGIGSTTSIGFATAEPKSNMNHMMAVLADTKIHQQQTLQIKIWSKFGTIPREQQNIENDH